jgi:hypothetical protein
MNIMLRLIVLFACVLMLVPDIVAQETSPTVIEPFSAVTGSITPSDDTQIWTFSALADEIVSLSVEAISPEFDPTVTLADDTGRPIISNDDYNYPESRDALLEAITIPRTGTYQVIVSGFGNTNGDFRLRLLPGYARITMREEFENAGTWSALDNSILSLDVTDETLLLENEGVLVTGVAATSSMSNIADFYAQLDVTEVSGRNGWTVGLALRRQGDTYYLYSINARGQWRFTVVEDGVERVLRDYTPHPAIVPGDNAFTFSVLANDDGFDVFYNDQLMGQVIDSTITSGGQVGVMIQTANAIGSDVRARVDNLAITRPVDINGVEVFPQRILTERQSLIVEELERRRVISPGGTLPLTVPESFTDSTQPGVVTQPLGRGTTFSTFVMGTTTTLTQNGRTDITGCGLVIRNTGEDNYTVAYMDNVGAYGISERNGDTFASGLYGENPDWAENESNNIVVVHLEEILHLFVNGVYVGSQEIIPATGEVGNVLINFGPADSRCQFNDTWLWRLD